MTAAQRAPREGALVDRYRLISALGTGPSAQVFRALDETSRVEVAVKLFDPYRCSSRGIRRYAEIAAAAAAVPQGAAVRLLEVLPDGPSPLAALELVPGHNLARMLQQHKLIAWTTARMIAARVTANLDAIHQVGLVHAALKPGNIHVLQGPGERLSVRLLDFGSGALLEPEDAGMTRANDNPAVDYLAPEQLQGEPERAATDLYALGVILYELVTGRRPFEGRLPDIVRQHLRTPPPAPRSLVPGLPVEADALILALLEKSPHQRPTMAELRRQLAPPVRTSPVLPPLEEPATAIWVRSSPPETQALETGPITSNVRTPVPGIDRTEILRTPTVPRGQPGEVTLITPGMGGDFLLPSGDSREDTSVMHNSSATVFADMIPRRPTPPPLVTRAPPPPWRRWLAAPWTFEKKLLTINFLLVLVILIGLVMQFAS
jgi:serine/threonine protein kinase